MDAHEIEARISGIRRSLANGDHKGAHIAEDQLYRDFIRYVAAADVGLLSRLAGRAIETDSIDFARWGN